MFYIRFKWENGTRDTNWYWVTDPDTTVSGSSFLANAYLFNNEELQIYRSACLGFQRNTEKLLLEIYHSSYIWTQKLMIGQDVRCT